MLFPVAFAGLALFVSYAGGESSRTTVAEKSLNVGTKVVAFYFHGNFRCRTCRTIEAYSEEAITKGFADEIGSGRLAWQAINVEEPENRHFVEDFKLFSKSLVLADYRDGKIVRHENLQQVWQLVRDKEAFVEYVRASTRDFLRGG